MRLNAGSTLEACSCSVQQCVVEGHRLDELLPDFHVLGCRSALGTWDAVVRAAADAGEVLILRTDGNDRWVVLAS